MREFKGKAVHPNQENQLIKEERIKRILQGDMQELNSYAEELGKYFARGREALTTSQIRNVLDEIQRMAEKGFNANRLQLLRPRLAYTAGRLAHKHKRTIMDFQKLVDVAIQMTDEKNFLNFKYFVEAIVAYHRYHLEK